MDVVHVVAVRDGHVSAPRPMLVVVIAVRHVAGRLALVDVALVHPVHAAVVDVVHVVTVRDGDMPAIGSVDMVVIPMLTVLGRCGHWSPPHCWSWRCSRRRSATSYP